MRAFLVAALLAAGCGETSPDLPDAGDDAGTLDSAVGPMPSAVAPAEMPRFACPDGWEPRTLDEGPTVCDPFPAGMDTCAPNERQLPGEASCVPIGPECPASDWADDEPVTGIVYVRPGATAGDGSRASPFGTLAEGVAAAADGETVLLAVGAYMTGVINLVRPVTLRGVCLDAVFGPSSAISIRSPGVRIENVRFQGAPRGPVMWSGELTLRSVAVRDVSGLGVAGFDGALDIADVSIRSVTDEGLRVSAAASLVARRVDISDVAVSLANCLSASCDIEDLLLVQPASSPLLDTSLSFGTSGLARVERAYIVNERTDTIATNGSDVRLTDVVIRGSPDESTVDEPSIFAVNGGTLELTRVWISNVHTAAVIVGGAGTTAEVRDVVVTDVRRAALGGGGYGFFVADGAQVDLERVWVERATAAGLLVTGVGTRVDASDLSVRRINPAEDGFLGRGIQVQLGSVLDGVRIDVADTPESGIIVSQNATATLRDLVVTDIHERACAADGCPAAGNGVATYLGGRADLERFQISNVALAALQLAMGGEMDATDGEVFDNPVGVNLQVDDFDLTRLTRNVLYRDNGVNLDSTSFEIPDPTAPPVTGL